MQEIKYCVAFYFIFGLLILGLLISCSQQGIIVTADTTKIKGLDDCFVQLGTPIESGGPILKRLCIQDIDKVLAFSKLEETRSKEIKSLLCGKKADPVKFKKYFDSLNKKERFNLIKAFEFYGYEINAYGC